MNVLGMNNQDGSPIADEAHYLRQSINDIINTPLGSRIMRRNYGSNVMELIDSPINEYTLIQIQSYLASTLLFQEKNIALKKLTVQQKLEKLLVTLEGNYIQSGNTINLSDIQLMN
ncbi:MAG: GPW/gp25 family protein [Pseudomonadota bacterium]